MDLVFKALADRNRRKLLDKLNDRQGQTMTELCAGMEIKRQSVARHLSILEQAGLVAVEWRGREKFHFLNPVPITQINHRWIDKFSAPKAAAVVRLKQALEQLSEEESSND